MLSKTPLACQCHGPDGQQYRWDGQKGMGDQDGKVEGSDPSTGREMGGPMESVVDEIEDQEKDRYPKGGGHAHSVRFGMVSPDAPKSCQKENGARGIQTGIEGR
jgi:hypothetical protein